MRALYTVMIVMAVIGLSACGGPNNGPSGTGGGSSGTGGGSTATGGGGGTGGGSATGGGNAGNTCTNGLEVGTAICEFGGNTLVACDTKSGALVSLRKVCGNATPSCAAEIVNGKEYAACCPDGNVGFPRHSDCTH